MSNESLRVNSSQSHALNGPFDQMYKSASLNNPILNEKLRNSQNSPRDIFNYLYETYAGGIGEHEYLCIIAGFDVFDQENNIEPDEIISNTIDILKENIISQEEL